ncbi:MAG TPA: hypothetical protein VEG39_21335 [Clostridia bacterium]|nr:hypothetical protein [Clostridia bacterium]
MGGKVAGIGSRYIANDYTYEQFRKRGSQKALLAHRIKKLKS